MPTHRMLFAFLAITASCAGVASTSRAEETMEISTTSYVELLNRVESLERNQSSSYQAPKSNRKCCEQGKCYAEYKAVMLTPFLSNDSAFIAENDPNLESVGFDWGMKYSTRVELGYMAPTGSLGWRARWWHFDQGESFFADDANGLIPSDEAEVFYALDVRIEDIDTGTFTHDLKMDVVDVEATKNIGHNVNMFCGLRVADVNSVFTAETDAGDAFSSLDFTGVGPTLGLRMDHCVTRHCSVYAGARGSMLFGEKTFFANTDDADLAILIENDNSLTYSTDLEIGTMYRRGHWLLDLAVDAQYWNSLGSALPNHISADDGADDAEGDGYNPLNVDLGLVGFSVGVGFEY